MIRGEKMRKIRLFLGVLFIALALIKIFEPSWFGLVINNIDFMAFSLFFIGIFLIIFNQILKLSSIIIFNKPQILRVTIAFLCLGLVILKMYNPKINIDNTSLYLIVIAVLIMVVPEIKDFIYRIKRFKKGDLELEFEELNKLLIKADEVESILGEDNKHQSNLIYSNLDDEQINMYYQFSKDPRGTIMVIAGELEKRITILAREAKLVDNNRYLPINKLMDILVDNNIFGRELIPLFRQFWSVRNQVAHGVYNEVDKNNLFVLIEVGMRLLKMIPIGIEDKKEK